jgi:hypothetical protein
VREGIWGMLEALIALAGKTVVAAATGLPVLFCR